MKPLSDEAIKLLKATRDWVAAEAVEVEANRARIREISRKALDPLHARWEVLAETPLQVKAPSGHVESTVTLRDASQWGDDHLTVTLGSTEYRWYASDLKVYHKRTYQGWIDSVPEVLRAVGITTSRDELMHFTQFVAEHCDFDRLRPVRTFEVETECVHRTTQRYLVQAVSVEEAREAWDRLVWETYPPLAPYSSADHGQKETITNITQEKP